MAYWGNDPTWLKLSPTQRAAAMALLEADSSKGQINLEDAKNALGAMINRADKEGTDLGDHVSKKIYQPTIEDAQFQRLPRILASKEFQELDSLAQARLAGAVPDWVKGATHFLAPEKQMLALEAGEPQKYKNWGPRGANWTKYGEDPERPNEYKDVVFRDSSHAFLAPEGAHSANFGGVGGNPILASLVNPKTPGVTEIAKTLGIGGPGGAPDATAEPIFGSLSLADITKAFGDAGPEKPKAESDTNPAFAQVNQMLQGKGFPTMAGPKGIQEDQLIAALLEKSRAGKLGA